MVRVVKRAEDRQDEILDTAQRLFMAHGYADTPVQTIIDAVGIAKGTFYHHYPSKSVLLDAIVRRMVSQLMDLARPIVADPAIGAVDKLNTLYQQAGRWKSDRREVLVDVTRALLSDGNALLRIRIERDSGEVFLPLLSTVIAQGVREGVFDAPSADYAARIVWQIGLGLSASLRDALVDDRTPLPRMADLEAEIRSFHDAVERVLGAPQGSVRMVDVTDIAKWLDTATERRSS